jgi:uncharacterized protein with GYD domain
MATYVSLLRYTEKGMANIKDGPARLEAAKAAFKAAGAEMKVFYLTMGQYDAVVISEGPDDDTVAKLSLAIGSQGNVRTETLKAFSEDDFRKIVSSIP